MRFQDQALKMIHEAYEGMLTTARAMPEDKLRWKPLDSGRSALELARECTQSLNWCTGVLQGEPMPDFTPEVMQAMQSEQAQWATLDDCERASVAKFEKLEAIVRSYPDGDLEKTIQLPFIPGKDFSMADMIMVPYWNNTYHTGQINYIQTLYGDREMH
jgi:glutathione S-transferase